MTVSVLGLGAMVSQLAARLLGADHAVTVWNRSPGPADALRDRGARVAASPAEAGAASDLVLSIVRDDGASRAVWEGGALGGLREGALAAEMSTLTPDRARQWAAAVQARGGQAVEAPVVGTRPHAEAGQLVVLAGGETADVDAARPALGAFAGAVHHVGPVGAGMAAKLAVNALLAVQAAAIAEVMAGLEAEGVARDRAAALLATMPTASPAGARLGTLMAEGATTPNFPVDLVAKDLGYARALVEAAGAAPHAVGGAERAFVAAAAAGFGGLDIAGVARLASP